MYLLGKFLNDFNPIFCQARDNSIQFIGARNHLVVHLKIFARNEDLFHTNEEFFDMADMNWNYRYAFNSDEVKKRIAWFRTKASSNKSNNLSIEPCKNEICISNSIVNTKLLSFVEQPPIPKIPEMDDGVLVQIADLKEMVGQVKSIGEEVVRLVLSGSELRMSGATCDYPVYTVHTMQFSKTYQNRTKTIHSLLQRNAIN